MSTKIFIYGEGGLLSVHHPVARVDDLESALDTLLGAAGRVIWDGDEHTGPRWNVDLLLYNDAEVEAWILKLVTFLRQWGVVDRTLSFTIIPGKEAAQWERRLIPFGPEQGA
jgi:hypothetical protein